MSYYELARIFENRLNAKMIEHVNVSDASMMFTFNGTALSQTNGRARIASPRHPPKRPAHGLEGGAQRGPLLLPEAAEGLSAQGALGGGVERGKGAEPRCSLVGPIALSMSA